MAHYSGKQPTTSGPAGGSLPPSPPNKTPKEKKWYTVFVVAFDSPAWKDQMNLQKKVKEQSTMWFVSNHILFPTGVFKSPNTREKRPLDLSEAGHSHPGYRSCWRRTSRLYLAPSCPWQHPLKARHGLAGGCTHILPLVITQQLSTGESYGFPNHKRTRVWNQIPCGCQQQDWELSSFLSHSSAQMWVVSHLNVFHKSCHTVCALYPFSKYSSRDVSDPLFSFIKTFCLVWQTGGKF